MICSWWEQHESPALPEAVFLPASGLIAETTAAVAVAWLFVTNGTKGGIGLIEFTTTNPNAPSRERLAGVKAIYAGLEKSAREQGCGSLLALVGETSSERHLMEKVDFLNVGGEPHLLYGKVIKW